MDPTQKLIELFKEFPGIGPRQARRFVYYILTRGNGYATELSKLILEIKSKVATCPSCFRFFNIGNLKSDICPTCLDQKRDRKIMMIVSHDVDFENIEKTGSFDGYYFILGGTVPILEKNPEKRIREYELKENITKRISEGLEEIIIAENYNPEGENTTSYLLKILGPICSDKIKISTLGRGLSTGTELEYSDSETIRNALRNRKCSS